MMVNTATRKTLLTPCYLSPIYIHSNYKGPGSELLPAAKFLLKEASAADLYPVRYYIVKIISCSENSLN